MTTLECRVGVNVTPGVLRCRGVWTRRGGGSPETCTTGLVGKSEGRGSTTEKKCPSRSVSRGGGPSEGT